MTTSNYIRFNRANKEHGFTLIELLVVILIIGILAAIAVPIFLNQRKAAVKASLESDLRNSATMMTTEATRDKGRYPIAMPDYTGFSDGNLITLVTAKSNREQFCMRGFNTSNEQESYYSSVKGTFVDSAAECGDMVSGDGASYADLNATKKAFIVTNINAESTRDLAKRSLQSIGYAEANITHLPAGSLTQSHVNNADTIILASKWHRADDNDLALAMEFYHEGGDVMVEGNDNRVPYFSAARVGLNSEQVKYTPTHNRVSPAFPYSFRSDSFNSDSGWICITELQNNAVAIASSKAHGNECIGMFAATNDAGGQFVYLTYAKPQGDNLEFTQTYAAVSWLMG